MNITWTFSPGAIIFASRFNTNFSDVKNWADAHEVATTNVHGAVSPGVIATTNANNVWLGTNTFTKITSFTNAVNERTPNLISNARLSLSAGVLSLLNEDGTAPSTTNPVYVRRINASGLWETITFNSATYCVIQDAASADSYFYNGVAGTPWGTTSTIAWGSAMPLFIYAATAADGSNPCLFFSRVPSLVRTRDATRIGYANNPPATPSQENCFAWTASNVTATHATQPCALIGYVEVVKDTNDDWTFQTLTNLNSGIGNYNFEKINYNMAISQNGAASGSYFLVSAGTAPTYATSSYQYKISRNGLVSNRAVFVNAAGGTPGAGAGSLQLATPFSSPLILVGNYDIYNDPLFYKGLAFETTIGMDFLTGAVNITGAEQNNVLRSVQMNCYFTI